jgi:hypothetical protein
VPASLIVLSVKPVTRQVNFNPRRKVGGALKLCRVTASDVDSMTIQYVLSPKTNGANPFKIFELLPTLDQHALHYGIKKLTYQQFLGTAYWFAVASVAKARAGMRCQVCNQGKGISVHHRTYDTHGSEHNNMMDLVVLDELCHGMFHGHITVEFQPKEQPKEYIQERPRNGKIKRSIVPHSDADIIMPDGDPIVLTKKLIDLCRANGSFTNATLRAFGMTKDTLQNGWPIRLRGKQMTREEYHAAQEGKFHYSSGPLK